VSCGDGHSFCKIGRPRLPAGSVTGGYRPLQRYLKGPAPRCASMSRCGCACRQRSVIESPDENHRRLVRHHKVVEYLVEQLGILRLEDACWEVAPIGDARKNRPTTSLRSAPGQPRPICDIRAMSAYPPTPDGLLRCRERSKSAMTGLMRRSKTAWSVKSPTLMAPAIRGTQ
jgi:hypothetical protein